MCFLLITIHVSEEFTALPLGRAMFFGVESFPKMQQDLPSSSSELAHKIKEDCGEHPTYNLSPTAIMILMIVTILDVVIYFLVRSMQQKPKLMEKQCTLHMLEKTHCNLQISDFPKPKILAKRSQILSTTPKLER